MFHKLANLNFSRGKMADRVLYGSKALLLETEIPKIVNLLADLAYYWREFGNSTNARKFFYACIYYRVKRHWQLSQELNYEKKQYDFTFDEEPNFNELIQISKQYISGSSTSQILSGKIININVEKQFGFIKQDSDTENIHFSFRNVIEKRVLHDNCRIMYEVMIDSRNMKEAINVRGE
jgi:cold shock CspA family protein